MVNGPTQAAMDSTIDRLVRAEEPVTLEALGGIQAITDDDLTSPLFPYAAEAIAAAWSSLDASERVLAVSRLVGALSGLRSGVAFTDVASVVVPNASAFGGVGLVKEALRTRSLDRADEQGAALAATALRWLAHLALLAPEARHSLLDVLSGVARGHKAEPMPFAAVAAQVAAVAYDHWRDVGARECLDRLTGSGGEADAWFGLGQARLVDALEAGDRDSMRSGLRDSLGCFSHASATGEDRPDAAVYLHAIRFVTEWADHALPEMLQAHLGAAEEALREYLLLGYHLPDQPQWLRPRFAAEAAWIDLVHRMRVALMGEVPGAWYQPGQVLGALADVYTSANSLHLARTVADGKPSILGDLVAPRLVAPVVEQHEGLALVDRWVQEVEDPAAEAFRALLRAQEVMPPKHRPPALIRR